MTAEIEKQSKKTCLRCFSEFSGDETLCPKDGTPLTKSKSESLVGTTFLDKYRVEKVIGGGGMGQVYRATHILSKGAAAIKVLHKSKITSPEAVRRFQVEAQAAGSLNSPNIVTLFDFGVSPDGQPYMIMECLDGPSLDAVLSDKGRLPPSRSIGIFVQICNALEHAHRKSVIHRDLKPSNVVLVTVEDDNDFVKIVDFGIAKVSKSVHPIAADLTKTGEVFGSPQFMSPEQVQGRPLDARTDIYSLGCIMYRTLTGTAVFSASDAVGVMFKHVKEPPVPFGALGLDVPMQLEMIVMKTLEKDPDQRYQSMQELAVALKECRDALRSGETGDLPTVRTGGIADDTAKNTWTKTELTPLIVPSTSSEPGQLHERSVKGVGRFGASASRKNPALVADSTLARDQTFQSSSSSGEQTNQGAVDKRTVSVVVGLSALVIAIAGGAFVFMNGASQKTPTLASPTSVPSGAPVTKPAQELPAATTLAPRRTSDVSQGAPLPAPGSPTPVQTKSSQPLPAESSAARKEEPRTRYASHKPPRTHVQAKEGSEPKSRISREGKENEPSKKPGAFSRIKGKFTKWFKKL